MSDFLSQLLQYSRAQQQGIKPMQMQDYQPAIKPTDPTALLMGNQPQAITAPQNSDGATAQTGKGGVLGKIF